MKTKLLISICLTIAAAAFADNTNVTNTASHPIPVYFPSPAPSPAVAAPMKLADGADTTLGAKADAKSTATDTTAVTIMQVLKEISAMVQAPPSQAVTNAGTFAVQSTGSAKQYTGVPSTFAVTTADGTVFTLAAGEVGFIQNLDDAAVAVKKGASASTSSFSFILKAGAAADDGTGGATEIKDWVGAVSIAAMTGSPRVIAWKQAP